MKSRYVNGVWSHYVDGAWVPDSEDAYHVVDGELVRRTPPEPKPEAVDDPSVEEALA